LPKLIHKVDFRTKLETRAYVAWLSGTLAFEMQAWSKALASLNQACPNSFLGLFLSAGSLVIGTKFQKVWQLKTLS
jgi:hypothetical protein